MENQPVQEVQPQQTINWRRLVRIFWIPFLLAISFLVYFRLIAPDTACVLNRDGEIVKAWGNDCKNLDGVEGIVLQIER